MQPAIALALALGLAYLLGDFPFQSFGHAYVKRRWVRVIGHGLIHWTLIFLLVLLFAKQDVDLSWRFAIATGIYVILQLAIGIGKRYLIDQRHIADSTKMFVADQALHCAILLGFVIFLDGIDWQTLERFGTISESSKLLALEFAVVYISVVFPAGYLIRYLTKGLVTGDQASSQESLEQLENAGLYIGWLERFLIVTAVVLRSPTLIGLILTGKSIARFPEMKEPKFAEYFLIGTLLSFTLALIGGLLLLWIWKGSVSLQP
jgi:hypothetical protein